MKIVFSTMWGKPKKLTLRGLYFPDNGENKLYKRTEAYLSTYIAYQTALRLEAENGVGKGDLVYILVSGSNRDKNRFANKIKAHLYLFLTFNKMGGASIGFDARSKYAERYAREFALNYFGETPYRIEALKSKEDKRYGLISFLDPNTVIGLVLAFCDLTSIKDFDEDLAVTKLIRALKSTTLPQWEQ
ncbi:MAG: hypothetical protein QXY76_03320 [Nitrososphaeria archaeon]